jgi:hypothetical protein
MSFPPSLLYLKIRDDKEDGIGIWLPLFLLWPLIMIILALVFLLTSLVDFFMFMAGASYHGLTRLVFGVMVTTFELRGLKVHVENAEHHVNITFV